MKNATVILLIALLLSSCGQGSNDATMYKKQVDSLVRELSVRPYHLPILPPIQMGVDLALDSATLPVNDARAFIQNWHAYAQQNMPQDTNAYSFQINADILRQYVLNDSSVKYLNVYLALNESSLLTLVYVGAKNVPQSDSIDEVFFFYTGDNQPFAFDRARPCPVCDKQVSAPAPQMPKK